MDDARRSVPGSCFCGSVRFEATLPSLFCAHCHCTMCRRHHGAAFVTWFAVPRSELRVVSGEDRLVRTRSSEHGTRSFCGGCGSPLFFETTQDPERVDIALANMTEPIDREPGFHVFFSDRVPWISVADALPRLGGATGFEPLDG